MEMQYDYNNNGTREELGLADIHPLTQNLEIMTAKLDAAYTSLINALMSKSDDLAFWTTHCNMVAKSHETAKMRFNTHEFLKNRYFQDQMFVAKGA